MDNLPGPYPICCGRWRQVDRSDERRHQAEWTGGWGRDYLFRKDYFLSPDFRKSGLILDMTILNDYIIFSIT